MSIISENRSKALWYELTDSDKKTVAVKALKEMSEYDFLKTLTNLHLFKTGVIVFDINCFSRNNEYSIVISDPIDTGFWFTGVSVSRSKALDLNKIFLEVVIANGFEKDALKILKRKKKLRTW